MTVFGGARPLPAGARIARRATVSRTTAVPRAALLPRAATLPRATTLPRAGARPADATAKRRTLSRASRISARSHPARPLIGAVLIAFLIGLIYVAQTVNLSATNFEIDQLTSQRDDLYRQVQTAETSLLEWGTEPTVLANAQRLGLDQLATRKRLSAP